MARSRLAAFAANYLRHVAGPDDVRSEDLAEALRSTFGLSPFPTLSELRLLAEELGIQIAELPSDLTGLDGLNVSYAGNATIYLRADANLRRQETTLGHELREVIENALGEADAAYRARATHDNDAMNPRSDRFAGYLLMETSASRELLVELGFDLMEFAGRTGRSLPSVVRRARQLYPASAPMTGPVMGAWLFEAPWETVVDGTATAYNLTLTASAQLCGFSQARGTREAQVFPGRGARAHECLITREALAYSEVAALDLRGFDLLGEHDYLVIAEPVALDVPWRVLLTAVRNDGRKFVTQWLDRVSIGWSEERFLEL